MIRRALSLIIFRAILVCVALLYQLLAWLVGFRLIPPVPFLTLVSAISLASWIYYWGVSSHPEEPNRIRLWVVVSLLFDGFSISFLVWMTGGVESNFTLTYLVIIPLGAIFLSKINIYVLTVFCFSMLYVTVTQVAPLASVAQQNRGLINQPEELAYFLASQFVIFFVTALVSALLQEAYRSSTAALTIKEQNIRWLKDMRNRIIDNMHSGLMTTDDHGVIRFANQMSGRLLHRDNSQLLGERIEHVLFIDVEASTELDHWPKRTETWVEVSGARRLMGISYSPIQFLPGKTGYLAVFQDLTEIKLMEQERRFKDKMAVIGRMAAGVAHEIRNPLASIKGSIQVLREFVPPDPDARELIGIVEKESNRLNDMITTFLAYSRPSGPMEMQRVDLVRVFEDFSVLAERDESIQHISLDLHPPTGDVAVFGDAGKLQQMFWNLVRNAGQASEPGSKVTVSFERTGPHVEFSIVDEGVGMTDAQVADLFTPFLSFREGGSGLGMSIVYEIVQLHHGSIDVVSKINEGTRVCVTFPTYDESVHGSTLQNIGD